MTSISDLSRVASLTRVLQAEQATLTLLSTQLSSQKKHTNLTDYTASEARNLINLQATATQKQAYLSAISTVSTNLSVYDSTLTDLESLVAQAQTLANNNPSYSESIASNVYIQASNFLKSTTVDLNQDLNGRFLYSGSRYNVSPVQELSTLSETSLTATIHTDDLTLPSYDSEWIDDGSTSQAAYTTDKAMVDTGYTLDYGITSNHPALQKMIAGLRYLQAAGNATDQAAYTANLQQAIILLGEALPALQTLHTSVANNINAAEQERDAIKTAISNLTTQVSNIQQVDVTQVSTEITMLETILQASYTVTGSLLKMSIVNFL
jgi:hypothetical protein